MAQRSNKSSLLASLSSLPTDNASVEAAWRQVLLSSENSLGMSQGEAYMFLSQCLEARVTQFANPSDSYVAKVASKYLV